MIARIVVPLCLMLCGTAQADDLVTVNAEFELAVPSVPSAADQVRNHVVRAGGYVVEEEFTGWEGDLGNGFIVVRVPLDQVDPLVETLEAAGHIEHRSVSSPRVEDVVVDREIAQENLEITRTRLQGLLQTEGITLEEILEIERELERIREEADQLVADQRDLSDRAEMASFRVDLRRHDEATLAPHAKFHPGPRFTVLATMDGSSLDRTYVGGGLTMLFHRAFTVDLDLYPGTEASGPGVSATLGTAVYSDFLGRGRRKFLNPYLGVRAGWAYLEPSHSFIVGPDVGLEIFKSEEVMIEADLRVYALFGEEPVRLAGQGTVSVVLPF